jgi:hypothetical protein
LLAFYDTQLLAQEQKPQVPLFVSQAADDHAIQQKRPQE